jgi:hypothetical protein
MDMNMKSVTRTALRPIQDGYCDKRGEAGNKLEDVIVEESCFPIREIGGVLNLEEVPQGAWGEHPNATTAVRIDPHLDMSPGGLFMSWGVG